MMKKAVGFFLFISFALLAHAGAPTLKTITVDGDMSDWASVLANPVQVTIDGASASPCSASTPVDLDCPVQSTGRDMVKFAWTYDATNIYLYVKRVGSSSNTQNFMFAMDVNQNKRMDSTDYVLVVGWQGSNRSTDIQLYTYVPADPTSGDPLVNASGLADGYSLPGSIGTLVWSDYTKSGGSASGQDMETYVPWSAIGVPYGTPIYYHVSASNNTKLSTAQDNLGGPAGGLGAFGYYLYTISPDQQGSTAPGGAVSYSHTLANTGTFTDTFTIDATSGMGYGLAVTVDGAAVTLPATVTLAGGATASIGVTVATAASPASAVDTTTVSATSAGDGGTVRATDTTYVGTVSLAPNGSDTAVAGMTASFAHTLTNLIASDTFNFSVTSSAGWPVSLYAGGTLIGTYDPGAGAWNVTTGYDADGNGLPDITVANGGVQPLTLVVTPPAGTAAGTMDTVVLNAAGATNGGSASVTDTTTVEPRLTVSPSYLISDGTNLYSGAGYPVYFAHTLVNSAPSADTFNFYAPGYTPSSSAGYAVTILSDPNGDGNPSDGTPITTTGLVAGNGGMYHFIVEVDVPASIVPPATDSTLVTAVRCADTGCTVPDTTVTGSVTDETMVSYIVPFQSAIHAVQRSAFAPCQTVYMGGYNLVANSYYDLVYKNSAGSVVRNVTLLADTNGTLSDTYSFPATASGTWTVALLDSGGNTMDTVTLTIQRSASILLQTASAGLPYSGGTIVANANLTSGNTVPTYSGTRVTYVVRSPGGSDYLTPGGTWAAYAAGDLTASHDLTDAGPGASLNDTFSAASGTFPAYGVYSIRATWESACGSDASPADDLAYASTTFYVVSWASYSDAGRTTASSSFMAGTTAYFGGQGYGSSSAFTVALYDPSGTLVASSGGASDASGILNWSVDTSTLSGTGTYHAVVYPAGASIPSVYSASDPALVASQAFAVTAAVALLRYGGVTSLSPLTPSAASIFVQQYPNDPALDPTADLEVQNFASGASFQHDTTDLAAGSPPLVFYELSGNSGDTLRVTKSGGKIVITY